MKKNYLLKMVFFVFLFIAWQNGHSQLAVWDFTGDVLTSTSSDSSVTTSSATHSGLTNTGDFFTCNGGAWSPSSWSTSASVNTSDDYAEYTITANSGFDLTVTGFTFTARRSSSGPASFSIRSSNDSYASDLLTGTISTSCASKGGTFSSSITVTSGNSLTIRIYGYNASSTGNMRMDDVTITGSSVAVGESVGFDASSSSETETDGTFNVSIPVTLNNYGGTPVSLDVTVDGSTTADMADYTLNTTSLSFTGDATMNISLDINDDVDSTNETVVLNISESTATGITISISQHTVNITDDDLPNIIINEILADPGSVVDANGDGVFSSTNDEFIELVNTDASSIDITGYTISDAGSVRHTFGSVTIPAGGSVVIFGGGTPTSIDGISGTASTGTLSFNNSSETITFANSVGSTIATYTYGSEANNDQSIGRSEDLNGAFVQHTTITSNAVTASPGKYNTSNLPFSTLTWKGTTDNDWATGSNWSTGTAPTGSNDVLILDVTNQPTASAAVTVNTVTMNSGTSLIAQSTFSGTLTYNRTIGTTNWYLVSSPFVGQTIVDFYTNESPALGSGSGDAQNVAIAPYDNSQALAADRWNFYTEGQVDGTGGDDTTDTFTSGIGYSIKMQAAGDVAFTGTMPVSDFTSLSLTDNSGGSGNAFNLMGNPYPSFIAADNTANATNNILSVNTSLLTEETIWMWDESANAGAGGYTQFNNTSGLHIAPGQGFFVSANGASSTFSITEAMQSHQGSDTFLRNINNRPEINLVMTAGMDVRDTDIFYIDGTTTSFDNGYDSSIFGGVTNELAIYTHAVANGSGKNLGIQSLPDNNFENMVIPVGINAASGTEITISAITLNLPAEINVYLEDKEDGSFTLLDSASGYTTTLSIDLNGIGRFFLHTSSQVLSTDEVNLDNISIYTSSENNLRIVGIQDGATQLKMYNILGRQVLNTSFEGNGVNDITLPNIRTGVYIIQLETQTGKLNKKIIIE